MALVQTQGVLLGRERECARIDQLLDGARAGRSGALVVRGEAGAGKTALLGYAIARQEGARIVHAVGVEAESEFAYAGLHELLLPLLDRFDDLPPVQAAALRGALALDEPQDVGRLYIGAATLSLLAVASGEASLLCVVDDAHALDRASADALTFAARRLDTEGVVMLFAARESGAGGFRAAGLPELQLGGLEPEAASTLVSRAAATAVSTAVGAELARATGGNPLALVDLAQRVTADQLAGIEPLPHPLPLGAGLQAAFAEQARQLSAEGRRALVIAATADTRAMRVITRAGGTTRTAFEECEDAGLLAIDAGQVDFSHPLVRSSVYHQASAAEKRAAHRAVADAFASDARYAERRAWHAAAATIEADEDVATQLELAGEAAASRRGHVGAAAMFERAARLTPDDEARARRLVLAARASWLAGQSERARRLLAEAEPADVLVRADAVHLLARIAHAGGEAGPDLVAEAALVERADPGRASVLLAAATETAPASERLDLARRALALVEGRQDAAELQALLALARSLSVAGRAADALAAMARAKALFEGDLAHDPELLLAAIDTVVVVDPDDDGFTRAMLDRATAAARGHAVMVLPRALLHSAWLEFAAGRWTAAYLGFVEAARLADETALPRERTAAVAGRALLDALQGREEAARAAVHELPVATAQRILGLLELGNGRGDVAAEHLARIADDGPEPLLLRGLPPAALDLTEAYLRGGRREEAAASATAIGDDDPSAAWAAALLGDAAAFERAALRTANLSLSRARIALNRGEALRRAGTRRDARKELEAALELFDALGAAPWAERARQELRASGASIRPREPSAAETLTPQELQVARTVATEASYKEAAAKLFLSPKTVEYHLHKVYRKLGITSGRQLMQRLSDEGLLE